MIFLRDRFTRGIVAGLIGGIPTVAINQGSYYLKLSSLRYLDFVSLMIFSNLPKSRGEAWFAFFVMWAFFGVLGSVFALLVPVIKSGNLILKGVIFGGSVWFLSYAVTVLFKVSELQNIPLNNAVSNFIGATIWGLALGFAFGWLNGKQTEDKQSEDKQSEGSRKRVFKFAPETAKKEKDVVHPVKQKKIK